MKTALLLVFGVISLNSSAFAMDSLLDSIEATRLLPEEIDSVSELFVGFDKVSTLEISSEGDQEILRVKTRRGCVVDFLRKVSWPRGRGEETAHRKSLNYKVVDDTGCFKG